MSGKPLTKKQRQARNKKERARQSAEASGSAVSGDESDGETDAPRGAARPDRMDDAGDLGVIESAYRDESHYRNRDTTPLVRDKNENRTPGSAPYRMRGNAVNVMRSFNVTVTLPSEAAFEERTKKLEKILADCIALNELNTGNAKEAHAAGEPMPRLLAALPSAYEGKRPAKSRLTTRRRLGLKCDDRDAKKNKANRAMGEAYIPQWERGPRDMSRDTVRDRSDAGTFRGKFIR